MKNISFLLPFLFVIGWTPHVFADDFPDGKIAQLLEDSKNQLELDVTKIVPGQAIVIEYMDRPIWIYRRTIKDLEYLSSRKSSHLADPGGKNVHAAILQANSSSISSVWARVLLVSLPEIEKTPYRSKSNDYLVVGRWGPVSGCTLYYRSPEERKTPFAAFIDPCVSTSYDIAGRVLTGVLTGIGKGRPAKYNLYVPPYKITKDKKLVIGLPKNVKLPIIYTSSERRYAGKNPNEKLIIAAAHNDLAMVRRALFEGAEANYFRIYKGSPIDAAIIGGSMEIIDLLVSNGAKPTPNSMDVAKMVKRQEVIKLLNKIK